MINIQTIIQSNQTDLLNQAANHFCSSDEFEVVDINHHQCDGFLFRYTPGYFFRVEIFHRVPVRKTGQCIRSGMTFEFAQFAIAVGDNSVVAANTFRCNPNPVRNRNPR